MPQRYAELLKRAESGNVTIHSLKEELSECTDRTVRLRVLLKLWEKIAVEDDREIVSEILRRCEAELAHAMLTPVPVLTKD